MGPAECGGLSPGDWLGTLPWGEGTGLSLLWLPLPAPAPVETQPPRYRLR